MRTFFKYLLAVIGGFLAVIALVISSVWALGGSPSNIAGTVTRVASSAQGGPAIGSLFIDQITSDADAPTRAAVEAKRAELTNAAGRALSEQEGNIERILDTALTAVRDGTPTQLDVTPVLNPVLAAMHEVEPAVPAQLDEPMTADINPSDLGPVAAVLTVLNQWWVLVLLALLALAGAGLCDRRGGMRRFRVSGITLAVSSLLVLLSGTVGTLATGGLATGDPQALVDAASGVARSTILLVSGLSLAVAVLVIVLSIVIKPKPAIL